MSYHMSQLQVYWPWHAPAKIKRGGHFCVLTGMWVFETITLHRTTNSAKSQAKIRFAFHFVERNNGGGHRVYVGIHFHGPPDEFCGCSADENAGASRSCSQSSQSFPREPQRTPQKKSSSQFPEVSEASLLLSSGRLVGSSMAATSCDICGKSNSKYCCPACGKRTCRYWIVNIQLWQLYFWSNMILILDVKQS